MRSRFEKMIRAAQDSIVAAVEEVDGKKFQQTAWVREGGGGGITRVLQVSGMGGAKQGSCPYLVRSGRQELEVLSPQGGRRQAASVTVTAMPRTVMEGGGSQQVLAAPGCMHPTTQAGRASCQHLPASASGGCGSSFISNMLLYPAEWQRVGEGGRGGVCGVRHHARQRLPSSSGQGGAH